MRIQKFKEFETSDSGQENWGEPNIRISDLALIHETSSERSEDILKNGFKLGNNDSITRGIYTISLFDKKEPFDPSNIELEINLKPETKIFWTNTRTPSDFYYGWGNKFFNTLFKNLGGNRISNKKEFLRNFEKWLETNGYSGVQQGGEFVITNLNSIKSISVFERDNISKIINQFLSSISSTWDPGFDKEFDKKTRSCFHFTQKFVEWAELNNIETRVIFFPQNQNVEEAHIAPIVGGKIIDFTWKQFSKNPKDNWAITKPNDYMKWGYTTWKIFDKLPDWSHLY